MKKIILLFIIFSFHGLGQNNSINDLKSKLARAKNDTSKVSILLKMSEVYAYANIDSNLFYKKKALTLSESKKLKTTPFIVCETIKVITASNNYNNVIQFGRKYFQKFNKQNLNYEHLLIAGEMGYAFYTLGEADSSSYYHDYLIRNANEKDKKERVMIVQTLRKRAAVYVAKSQYDKAIVDLEKAIQLVDTSNYYDAYSIYAAIADAYTQFGDYYRALENFDKANEYVKKTKDFLSKMHILYSYADFYRTFKNYKKANAFALKGVKFAEENNQPYGLMILKSILAKTYIDLGRYENAKPHLEFVIEHGTQFQAYELVAVAEYDLGTISNINKEYKQAIAHCEKAWEFFNETSLFMHKASTCQCLSDANSGLLQYDKALFYYKESRSFKDSINSEEQIKKTYQLQSKYDLEKRDVAHKSEQEQRELIASQKLKTKNQLITAVSIFAVLVIALSFSIFKTQQRKRETEVAIQKEKDQEKFSQQLLQSQENEKVRISRELHDSVGQDLILLKNKAHAINDPELENSIASTLNNVRRITQGLHPFVLEQFGLTSALKKLIETIDKNSSIFISEEIDEIDNLLSKQQELGVYRIIQEAINNILKHSESPSALIVVKRENNSVVLSIKDYGKGFDWSEKSATKNSLGMKTLQERAKILNAEFNIDSELKKGTTIYLKIPIQNA